MRDRVLTSPVGRRAKEPIRRVLNRIGYEIVPTRHEYHQFVRGLLTRLEVTTLVDVGANAGQFALEFRRIGFNGKILSFEPVQDAYRALIRQSNADPHWEARMVALGKQSGVGTINVAANSVSSSLLPMDPLHLAAEPTSRTDHAETVKIATLDSELASGYLNENIWLKIDVQGYEGEVLAGAERTLSTVRVLQCELSTTLLYAGQADYIDVLQRIRDAEFTPVQIIPGFVDPREGTLLQFDVIAARLGDLGTGR